MRLHHTLGVAAAVVGAATGLIGLLLDRSGVWSSGAWLVVAFVAAVLVAGGIALMSIRDLSDLRTRIVQPRVVWTGTGLMILGGILAGLALISSSPLFALPAVVVVGVGAVTAWLGGVMGSGERGLGGELHQVAEGETYEGHWPDDEHDEPRIRARAAAFEDSAQRISGGTTRLQAADLGALGAVGVLGLAGWLFVSRWVLGYPFEPQAVDAHLLHTGMAIVVGACGLWLAFLGRSVVAAAIVAVLGVALVLAATLGDQPYQRVRVDEIVTGVLLVASAVASLLTPRSPGQERSQTSASSR